MRIALEVLACFNPLTAGVAYMRHPQLYPIPPVSHIYSAPALWYLNDDESANQNNKVLGMSLIPDSVSLIQRRYSVLLKCIDVKDVHSMVIQRHVAMHYDIVVLAGIIGSPMPIS